METSNKKTRIANHIFFIILTLLIISSVAVSFVRIVIQKDYQVVAEASCDPEIEKCFVYICDPVDDESCPIEETERVSYYKIISKKAANIAECEATINKIGCNEELSCTEGEEDCSYAYCDSETEECL